MDAVSADPFGGEEAGESSRPPRAYHSKRPHKKSRAGCTNCKHRKVKCDEARPACRACILRSENCVYIQKPFRRLPPPVTQRRIGPPPPWDTSEESTTPEQQLEEYSPPQNIMMEPLFRPFGVSQYDMKLLWFYTASTCKSFNAQPSHVEKSEQLLRVELMQYAFDKRFLMDTILALSSLHTESLNMQADRSLSLQYRGAALRSYTEAIQTGDPETFPALLGSSLLMTALASADFRDPQSADLHIIGWMKVWRGIGLMIEKLSLRTFLASPIHCLFRRPAVNLDEASHHIPMEVMSMLNAITPADSEYGEKVTYHNTLKYLGSLYQHLKDDLGPEMKLRIITWFTFIPKRFVELAQQLRPRALVILAHYAAFLKLTQRVWWMIGIGDRTLADLVRHLPRRWHLYMLTPIDAASVHDIRGIGRLLTGDGTWMPKGDDAPRPSGPNSSLSYVDDVGNTVSLVGDTVVRGGPIGETVFNSQLYPPEHYIQQKQQRQQQ